MLSEALRGARVRRLKAATRGRQRFRNPCLSNPRRACLPACTGLPVLPTQNACNALIRGSQGALEAERCSAAEGPAEGISQVRPPGAATRADGVGGMHALPCGAERRECEQHAICKARLRRGGDLRKRLPLPRPIRRGDLGPVRHRLRRKLGRDAALHTSLSSETRGGLRGLPALVTPTASSRGPMQRQDAPRSTTGTPAGAWP